MPPAYAKNKCPDAMMFASTACQATSRRVNKVVSIDMTIVKLPLAAGTID
jgi:hypothetical protein